MLSWVHLLKITNLQLDCLSHSLHQPLNGILAACSPQVTVMLHFLGIFSKQLPDLMQIFSVELTAGFWIAANIVIQLFFGFSFLVLVFWVFLQSRALWSERPIKVDKILSWMEKGGRIHHRKRKKICNLRFLRGEWQGKNREKGESLKLWEEYNGRRRDHQ